MGTLTPQKIINKISGSLMNDAAKVRFKEADSLVFVNEALKFIAGVNPSAYSDIVEITLVAGSRQTVPATAHTFMGAPYNLNGSNPGRAITVVKRETLDAPNPNWRAMSQATTIKHIVADDDTPTIFHTYPPAVAGTKIAGKVGLIPVDLAIGATIPLEDTYEVAITNFVLSRLYQKNGEYAGNAQLAQQYWQSALQSLGMKAQVDPASSAESETRGEAS